MRKDRAPPPLPTAAEKLDKNTDSRYQVQVRFLDHTFFKDKGACFPFLRPPHPAVPNAAAGCPRKGHREQGWEGELASGLTVPAVTFVLLDK